MKTHYSIAEFYLLLKLGLFRGGNVGNWGYILNCNRSPIILRKSIDQYYKQLYAKKQLNTGLYLLDVYPSEKYGNNQGVYIVIISVCRTNLFNKEKIYILKLISPHNIADINILLNEEAIIKKRKSIFRKKPTRRIFDSRPLNSITRKY